MCTLRCFCFLFLVLEIQGQLLCNDSELLHECLFAKYNEYLRPGRVSQQITRVGIKFSIVSIDYVNLKHRTIKTDVYLDLTWTDKRLRWDAKAVDNITWVTADPKKIWKPDLMLSSVDESMVAVTFDNTLARIQCDGTVNIYPYFHVKLRTDVDITNYPFDAQTFSFVFEAWSYSVEHLLFSIDEQFSPLDFLVPSGEWEAVDYQLLHWNKTYSSGQYNKAGYYVKLKRRSLYYILNILGPVFVVSLLNTLCFILPVSSGDRVTLCISIFITLAVFLASVSDSLPKTSEGVSVCIIYIGLQMIGSAFTTFMVVLIIAIENCDSEGELSVSRFAKGTCCWSICCRCCCCCQGEHSDKFKNNLEEKYEQTDQTKNFLSVKRTDKSRSSPEVGRKRLSIRLNILCLVLSAFWNFALFVTIFVHAYI